MTDSKKRLPLVAMISKPVVPPWNDSARNIVKDQVTCGETYNYRILTTRDTSLTSTRVCCDPLYSTGGRFSAGIRQNLKVMFNGLFPGGASIYHYFFAPNTTTALAGRIQSTVARVKTVQTVCSRPASFKDSKRLLFTDRVIALSADTRDRFVEAGLDPRRVIHIRPGIVPIDPPGPEARAAIRRRMNLGDGPLVLFPGDYEFSNAAATVADAAAGILEECRGATLVFACRIKREPSRAIQAGIQSRLLSLGSRVAYVNQVDDMPAFVGAADVVIMPAESLYAKMDVPLVLLEAMSQRVPLVIARTAPLGELLTDEPGLGIEPGDAASLTSAVAAILKDRNLADRFGDNGRRAVLEKFSAKSMAKEVENLYDDLLYGTH